MCIGATLIAAFGAMKEPAHTLDELLDLLAKRQFLLWMGGTMFMAVGILVAVKANSILRPRLRHTARMRMIRGIAYGCVRYYSSSIQMGERYVHLNQARC